MSVIPESGNVPPVDETGRQSSPKRFVFHGQRRTLAWMVFKYALLTLFTLGIYRFWAKTHLRRYLWSATEFDGDRFEWHGTVKELFIGFLIALVVLLPMTVGDSLVRSTLIGSETSLAAYSIVYSLVFLFLINFAFYRMWRYRMTRTSWRSIRCNMTGSGASYALNALMWLFITGLTLGIAYPWMQAALTRKRLNETEVGGTPVECDLRGGSLFGRYILCYGLGIVAMLVPVAVFGLAVGPGVMDMQPSEIETVVEGAIPYLGGFLVSAPLMVAIFLYYRTYAYQKTVENTQIGETSLSANISLKPLLTSAVLTGFAVLVIQFLPIGVIVAMAMSADATGMSERTAEVFVILLPSLMLLSMVAIMPLSSAAWMAGFVFTAVRNFLQGTVVENPDALHEIVQNAGPAPKTGEGFADALDVGAF